MSFGAESFGPKGATQWILQSRFAGGTQLFDGEPGYPPSSGGTTSPDRSGGAPHSWRCGVAWIAGMYFGVAVGLLLAVVAVAFRWLLVGSM